MQNVFLSFHFTDEFDSPDSLLANRVQGLLESHGLSVRTGGVLGGGPLSERVKELIDNCDALVALMTRRDNLQDGKCTTHQWVLDEHNYARGNKIRAIAIIENCVEITGMYQHHEYIKYDPNDALSTFLTLSATIGNWKANSGRLVKLRIQPDQMASDFGEKAEWRYRFNKQGAYSEWQDADLSLEEGGCFLYLPNVLEDVLIQIRTHSNDIHAVSKCAPQWVTINLNQEDHD